MRLFRTSMMTVAALILALMTAPALAVNTGGTQFYANWSMQGKTSLSAGTTSSRVALPTASPSAYICNRGSVDAYVTFGIDNTVVATQATGSLVMAGNCQAFNLQPINSQWTYVAGITASSTATLYIETGLGHPQTGQSAGAGGGGVISGTVTANQGTAGGAAWPVSAAPATGAPTVGGALIGTSSAQLLAAGTRVYTSVQNVSASAMVACRWGGTAILNDINSFMLFPGGSKTYEGSYVPSGVALNCISDTASTPVYAEVK